MAISALSPAGWGYAKKGAILQLHSGETASYLLIYLDSRYVCEILGTDQVALEQGFQVLPGRA